MSYFAHPAALVESNEIGDGTRVWAFAHVLKGAVVGANCNVCDHVFIEDGAVVGDRVTLKNNVLVWRGVVIEDDVFVGPGVVFTNDLDPRAEFKKPPEEWLSTLVRRGATLGANSTIICGVEIGRYAFIGAGAVVTRSVPDHQVVVGNPARPVGWVCTCAHGLDEELLCGRCGRRFVKSSSGVKAE